MGDRRRLKIPACDAQLIDSMDPARKFGRNLEWYLASKRMTIRAVGRKVVTGTDHAGATLALGTSGHGTLGLRMINPTPIPHEALGGFDGDQWEEEHAGSFGEAPGTREEWTYQAGLGLTKALRIDLKDDAVHGGGPSRYSPHRVTHTQGGEYGTAPNRVMRNLRLKAARQDRYQLLVRTGACARERDDLWWKLCGNTELGPAQRQTLENWLEAARRKRNWDWAA